MEIFNTANTNTKEILVQIINKVIDNNRWGNKEAAHMLQTALDDISRIRNSKTASFSLERLLIFLVRLNCEVTIVINSKESMEQDISFECAISASQC